MKTNSNTRIIGARVVLVPYREEHVEKYHEWMKSPELQHLTGSEPLTLEEEYEMQKSWGEDENKCTFIVLDAEIYSKTNDEIVSMIGDTNLYFNDPDDIHASECEIMVAEETARGRKMGWEAIILMLRYGVEVLKVSKYSAKIKMDNEKSIRMFQKLKFTEASRSEVFQEITLLRKVNEEWSEWLVFETSGACREDQYCSHKFHRERSSLVAISYQLFRRGSRRNITKMYHATGQIIVFSLLNFSSEESRNGPIEKKFSLVLLSASRQSSEVRNNQFMLYHLGWLSPFGMSLSKNILNFVKKPLIFNSLIYGSFYTSAEFLQQTYKLQERKKETSSTARALTVTESTVPLVVIGSQSNSRVASNERGKGIHKTIDKDGYNWSVLQRYVVYGFFLAGPILHKWYLWLDSFYVGIAGTTLMKKLFCDQFLLTPPLLVLFFSSMSLMEGKEDILEECRAKFLKTFQTSCLYWLPMQFVNFLMVPAKFRVVFVSIAAFLWVNILCHLKRTPVSSNEQ
ncbi:uncharacterized protein LOC107036373 [Diachasma alloeum]|uniref:uncharacterized protein LOC107036373 n=1 Tax=Diachasma alloeum TaxID=454923 RepID=UPI0007381B2F|nr:uncharacterized protein LOC107036373 [Diachasma alloeum]